MMSGWNNEETETKMLYINQEELQKPNSRLQYYTSQTSPDVFLDLHFYNALAQI